MEISTIHKKAENSDWLFEQLLNQGVIIRKLGANNMHDFVRISIGLESEMNHFYEAFNKLYPQFETMLKGSWNENLPVP